MFSFLFEITKFSCLRIISAWSTLSNMVYVQDGFIFSYWISKINKINWQIFIKALANLMEKDYVPWLCIIKVEY